MNYLLRQNGKPLNNVRSSSLLSALLSIYYSPVCKSLIFIFPGLFELLPSRHIVSRDQPLVQRRRAFFFIQYCTHLQLHTHYTQHERLIIIYGCVCARAERRREVIILAVELSTTERSLPKKTPLQAHAQIKFFLLLSTCISLTCILLSIRQRGVCQIAALENRAYC